MRRGGAIGLALLLSGCLKPIDVDVPADAGELVVEAYYNDADSAVARLSRTMPYFSEGVPQPLAGAVVLLEEVESGAVDTLRWRDSVYIRVGGRVRPVVGHTYRLRVYAGQEQVEAYSRLPEKVPIDTLLWLNRPAEGPLPAGPRVISIGRDPANQQNAYRIRVWRNDTLQNRLFEWIYSDDRYIDGRLVVLELPFRVELGDTLTVEQMCIPVEVIRFYDQLVRNAFGGSGGFSPPPDNAYSNFTGSRRRVWGYFIAYSSDKKGIRIR